MAAFLFMNSRRPRKYEHKPIYWDPEKEKEEERERRIKREMGIEEDLTDYKPQIKGSFYEGTTHLRKSVNRGDDMDSRKYRNVKLAAVLIILALVGWFIFLK
ncbi:hypothetical protein [Massilibacteroides vaginae]|uniref:hypothetical protein n=1 Tax=Massilibacteroides vaginae TaxID=1673718 RepID=UPI000A1CC820|nr:hypothetical protein [Massilibacteroides vaginae]